MLHFFTDPYKDELIYSAIARYHHCIGNVDLKDTLEECFGKRTITPSLEFGSPTDALAKNIGGLYTADYIIKQHTLLPYYSPFLPKFRKEEIISDIKFGDCSGIYAKIGIVAGSICKKYGIYYCPICAKNEIQINGEAFIHREHQLQGISICVHHGVILKKYSQDKMQRSRLEFIKLEKGLLNLRDNSQYIQYYEKMMKLAKDAYCLINADVMGIEKDMIFNKYKNLLYERGLTTSSKKVRQNELYEEFINYYGKGFLEVLKSNIDNYDEYNWLRVITRHVKRVVHPIRHILLIGFLTNNICEFFQDIKLSYNPFGNKRWPCLNKVSDHFMVDIIDDLRITEDYKTRLPVGTFTCSCGFVYSRKGPDKSKDDRYKIGRIMSFGSVWEEKLKGYLLERKYGLREVARLMHCDPKTITKFDRLLGVNYFHTNSSITIKSKKMVNISKLEIYKNYILEATKKNMEASRTEVRDLCKKQYMYIYRYDKKWLYEKLPQRRKTINQKGKINWEERDNELLNLIQNKYKEMMNLDIPVRITKSSIGKRLGILATLEKNISKLSKTEECLKEIVEEVEEFQFRRCKKIIDKKIEDCEKIMLWELQKNAGIRRAAFNKIKIKLEKYIEEKYRYIKIL